MVFVTIMIVLQSSGTLDSNACWSQRYAYKSCKIFLTNLLNRQLPVFQPQRSIPDHGADFLQLCKAKFNLRGPSPSKKILKTFGIILKDRVIFRQDISHGGEEVSLPRIEIAFNFCRLSKTLL